MSERRGEKLFDPVNFSRMVHNRMGRLTQREAAKEIGVSASTFSRVHAGKAPDIETYLRLKRWMERNPHAT